MKDWIACFLCLHACEYVYIYMYVCVWKKKLFWDVMSFKATFENSSPVTDLHYLYLLAITINSLFFRLDPCISCMT